MKQITEQAVLSTLDNSINGTYNDFVNLDHGYFELANCRLTLFKNNNEWAMVFEKFGYNARGGQPVQLEVAFFGNCLRNLTEFNNQLSNIDDIGIDNDIYKVLQADGEIITIRGEQVLIPTKIEPYQKYGIEWDFDGKNYIGAVLKYLAEEHPELTRATDDEVRRCLPPNLKKIMTLDEWHQEIYHKFDRQVPPSKQETFQMLAKVLVTGDTTLYKPTKKPNTHWSNWPESGGL